MRAVRDNTYRQFADWLLRIGNGEEPQDAQDKIRLPNNIVVSSLEDMLQSVYPSTQPGERNLMLDPETMSERCCLTPKNDFSHQINSLVLQQLNTDSRTYLSTDRVVTDDPNEAAAYPIEFLNVQTPSGMPLHNLELKVR